jgi:class 3 adenylate cyclase/TolB-like protein/Flp pilus assembly protein TadD
MNSHPDDSPVDSGQRKLSAIFFSDMKGFSKRMGNDEFKTLRSLKVHNALMTEAITRNHGRTIKTLGDAFIATFDSALDAINCAIQIQQQFYEHNKKRKEDEEDIVIRIGIHVGDIFITTNDAFGDGINIAARVQSIAPPGGIYISEDAIRTIRSKITFEKIKLGKAHLKNITIPVTVYQVILPWHRENSPGLLIRFFYQQRKMVLAITMIAIIFSLTLLSLFKPSFFEGSMPSEEKSMVVLPFTNFGVANIDYLSDGFTSDIISRLSGIREFFIITKSAAFQFKNSNISEDSIAASLHVRFALKGTLQCANNRIKLTVVLFDSKTKKVAWRDTYDKEQNGIVTIENIILEHIVSYFDLQAFSNAEKITENNPQAYDYYLKGLFYSRKAKTKEDNILSIENFTKALDEDSLFLQARRALAEAQKVQYEEHWSESTDILNMAERNCGEVLVKDSMDAHSFAVLGDIKALRGDKDGSISLYEKALRINPYDILALTSYGGQFIFDKPERAIALLTKAAEVEPTSATTNSNLGIAYAQLKNYQQAINSFKQAIRCDSNNVDPWNNLGYAYERVSHYDQALEAYINALSKKKDWPLLYTNIGILLLAQEKYAVAESVLTEGINYCPKEYELRYMLGLTLQKERKLSKSRNVYLDGLALLNIAPHSKKNSREFQADECLFKARLGMTAHAAESLSKINPSDISEDELAMKITRAYAILKNKSKAIEWFNRAKALNVEYDEKYLSTAVDLDSYRTDPDFISVARQ